MNKNSILKKLLAIGVGAVCVTTGALFAACNDKKKDDNKDPGTNPPPASHSHQWSTGNEASAWGKNATHHWRLCLADGHGTQGQTDAEGYGTHDWSDAQDTTCNTCGYVRTISGGSEDSYSDVSIKFDSISSISNGTSLGDGVSVYVKEGKNAPSVEASGGKSPLIAGTATPVTHRLTLKSKSNSAIKLDLPVAAKVIVYVTSNNGDGRTLGLYASEELAEASQTGVPVNVKGNDLDTVIFDAPQGVSYIASSNDLYIFYVIVSYSAVNETWEEHPEVSASCGVQGNIAYSSSNYGRYKNASGTLVSGGDIKTAALTHSYTLKADSITAPTASAVGSATLTCANGHETPVELPILTSEDYTSRPNVGVTGEYAITVEGVSITFQAEGVAAVGATYTDVYKLDDFTDITVGTSNTAGSNCVYTGTGTAATVNNGVLKCGNADDATNTYISLGTAITSGIVKISGNMTVASTNGSWTFFQLLNADATPAEFVGFRTDSGGVWGYRTEGTGNPSATPVAANKTQAHDFEIIIDFDKKKVSITVDSIELCKNAELGVKATGLSAIMINCNAGRYIDIASIAIATQDSPQS